MKNRTLGLIIVLFTANSMVFGQDAAFKVLANKGNNEVKNGATWQPLKTGASLKSGDELRLSENSYLALVHIATGRPKELKEAKVYSIDELNKGMEAGGTSVMHKYADFILTSSTESQKNRLSATGAVTRATSEGQVELALPKGKSTAVFNDVALIKWNSPVQGPFKVVVLNMFDDTLAVHKTPENFIEINVNDPKFKGEPILVQVYPTSDPTLESSKQMVEAVPAARRADIETAFSEIQGLASSETAVSKVFLAGFYEQNGLIIDALGAYEKAIELAPDVPDYVESYQNFLIRNGINLEIEK